MGTYKQSSLEANTPEQVSEILGIDFANISQRQAMSKICQLIESPQPESLFFVNAHCLNMAYQNYDYRLALRSASLRLPDGSGVSLGCKVNQESLTANLNGTDLFPPLCGLLSKKGKSVFFLGAEQGTAEKVADWAAEQYPELEIAGCHHGHFSADESQEVIDIINQSGADVLIVAMGVPRQELWIEQSQTQLATRLNIAVGGLFEFYSDNIPRAPLWMRKAGVEWVWRLMQEPKRMWQRYIIGNLLFLWRVVSQSWSNKARARLPHQLDSKWQLLKMAFRMRKLRAQFVFDQWFQRYSKRSFDVLSSGVALLCLLPFLPIVAFLIKLESPGPVFFKQQRAGLNGKAFDLWKFRSMYIDAEQRKKELAHLNEKSDGIMFKMKNDPRITKVGKFIRRFSIDELPQLWNVFVGDMSVVGPRPALYSEVAQYKLKQRRRLDTKPGLTSEWAIAGRNALSFEQQAELDVEYFYHHSFWNDIKLILKTIPIVFSGRGAS